MEKRYFLPWEWRERQGYEIQRADEGLRADTEWERHVAERHKRAIKYYEASGISELVNTKFIGISGFRKKIIGNKLDEDERGDEDYSRGVVTIKLSWDGEEMINYRKKNTIKIVVFSSGDISFFTTYFTEEGKNGNSSVKYEDWSGKQQLGKNTLLPALDNAFRNPGFDLIDK